MDIMVIGIYQLYDNYGTPEHPHWKAKGSWTELLKRGPADEILATDINEFDKLGMAHVIDNKVCRYYFTDWMFFTLDSGIVETVADALEENPDDIEYAKFESCLPDDVWKWGYEELQKQNSSEVE